MRRRHFLGAGLAIVVAGMASSAMAQDRFGTVIDSAPINIALYSHDLRLLYVNPDGKRFFERPLSFSLTLGYAF